MTTYRVVSSSDKAVIRSEIPTLEAAIKIAVENSSWMPGKPITGVDYIIISEPENREITRVPAR
jgi:hypothetical protein